MVSQAGPALIVRGATGEAPARVPGRLRREADVVRGEGEGLAVVGDWVLVDATDPPRVATGAVRADGRGRHTTVRRELHRLPGGGLMVDTPGIRALQTRPGARRRMEAGRGVRIVERSPRRMPGKG